MFLRKDNVNLKNSFFRTLLLFLISIAVLSISVKYGFAQTDSKSEDVKVTQMTFDEELTEDDELESGFGRFDVFEIYFKFGDKILIDLYSPDFSPTLALISPDKEDFIKFPETGRQSLTYQMAIPRTGDWLLIVRGDSLALGKYHLSCWWADVKSLQPEEDADLCDQVNFIFAHANADFVFLKKPRLLGSEGDSWQPTVDLEGAINTQIINPGDESYVANMYKGNDKEKAKEIYSNLVARIKFCNNNTWPGEFKDWYEFDVFNNLKKMDYQINEEEREDFRFARVEVVDYSGLPTQFRHKYAVNIVISRYRPENAK